MRRALALALAAIGLALGAAGAGGQDDKTVAVTDGSRDVRGGLDLRRVALTKVSAKRVRGEITLRRRWGTADLRGVDGAAGSLCMRMWGKREHGSEPPDWLACVTPAAEGDRLVGRVLRDRPNRLPETVGSARVTRPSDRTVHLRFPRRVFRRAFGVHFGAESVSRRKGCPGPVGCRDLAPDAPDAMYLQLR